MSAFVTQLEQAILVAAVTARPDLTPALGEQSHDQIPPGSLPFAYTTGFSRAQAESDDGTVTTYVGALVIVGEGDLDAVRQVAEDVAAGLGSDVTLGGLVRSLLVGIDSFPDPGGTLEVAVLVFDIDAGTTTAGVTGAGPISWQVAASVQLVTTPVTTWEANRAAAIVAALGAGAARFDSDLVGPETETVPAGSARFALSLVVAPVIRGSNQIVSQVAISLRVMHALAAGAAERTYTMATMLAQMAALAAPSFWLGAFTDASIPDDGEPEVSDLTR